MVFYENARWLKDRFQSMGPAEAMSRLADVGRHAAVRASLKSLQGRPDKRFRQTKLFNRGPEIQKQLDDVSTRARDAVMAAASRWLEHRASFFSLKDVWLGKPIDWHRDYSSGVVGPVKYTGFINPRDTKRVGDIKYIWELNRLQHLVLLALAQRWSGDPRYWLEIQQQVGSWKQSNPFMMGVNWKSPLEAGLRLISWAYVSFLAGEWNRRQAYDKLVGETVYHHQYFIRKFFSKNSSANNHLIGEMAGLYVASVIWPCFQESTAWRSFARRKLIQEIVRQVEPDGVGCERAIEYQLFILELFLLVGALGQVVGDPFPQQYWERIGRMAGFLLAISNRTGDLPRFGDGDSGQVIALPETIQERSCALVSIGGRDDNNPVARDLPSILLLWGQSPKEIPMGPARSSAPSLQVFPNGGYGILAADRGSENEILVVFDAGPLGLPPLNAHGHADALSFCLSYGGREFLIDPGTYCYQGMTEWRSYFRGTAAHNTVRIDGENQSVICGPFLWREAANSRIEHMNDTGELIEIVASHDGYRRLDDPVVHIRDLRFYKKSRLLVVADRLDCRRAHRAELSFHFSEQCHIGQTGPNCFEALNGEKRIRIILDSRLRPELYHGSEQPIFGWVSREFGVKEPAFTLVGRDVIVGTTQFVTEISAI